MLRGAVRAVAVPTLLLLAAGAAWAHDTSEPMPTLRIIFFTPAGVKPPAGVPQRMTQVADYAEHFFDQWMTHWGYAPANKQLFQRKADGTVEVLFAQGKEPPSSPRYTNPNLRKEAINVAKRKYKIPPHNNIWWTFVYLGSSTTYKGFRGGGDPRQGGWAVVRYEPVEGQIRTGTALASGVNRQFTLKGKIHELSHGFGLPHVGPRMRRRLGNSLMGPRVDAFAKFATPRERRVYLSEATAAMLWKHPLFSGTAKDRNVLPSVKVDGLLAAYDRRGRKIQVSGKLISNYPAHSVVVLDQAKSDRSDYWHKAYVGKIQPDGTFTVEITELAKSSGQLKIAFCFNNGAVTGDGKQYSLKGAIVKKYQHQRTGYRIAGKGAQTGRRAGAVRPLICGLGVLGIVSFCRPRASCWLTLARCVSEGAWNATA